MHVVKKFSDYIISTGRTPVDSDRGASYRVTPQQQHRRQQGILFDCICLFLLGYVMFIMFSLSWWFLVINSPSLSNLLEMTKSTNGSEIQTFGPSKVKNILK